MKFHRMELVLFQILKNLALRTPQKVLSGIQYLLYLLTFYLFRVTRKTVESNLQIAFAHKTDVERHQIAKQNYQWICKMLFETLRLEKQNLAQIVHFENLEILDEALAEKKGVLLLGAHFGHWEAMAQSLASLGYAIHGYAGQQSNLLVDQEINQIRSSFGTQIIGKGKEATYKMMKALKSKEVLAMLVDQHDHKSKTVVKFFGKNASFSQGPARFHLKTHAPLIFAYAPIIDGKTTLKFKKIKLSAKHVDIPTISQAISNTIESVVKQYPEQYFWMHKRWKGFD